MTPWRKLLCNILGWHRANPNLTLDGMHLRSTRQHCLRPVTMDDDGNWLVGRGA